MPKFWIQNSKNYDKLIMIDGEKYNCYRYTNLLRKEILRMQYKTDTWKTLQISVRGLDFIIDLILAIEWYLICLISDFQSLIHDVRIRHISLSNIEYIPTFLAKEWMAQE